MLAVIGTPAGCAEYGSLAPDAPISKRTVLASGVDRFGNQCRLEHVGEGWTPAGSVARWQEERWAYAFTDKQGTRGGQQYRTLPEAEAHFSRATNF